MPERKGQGKLVADVISFVGLTAVLLLGSAFVGSSYLRLYAPYYRSNGLVSAL